MTTFFVLESIHLIGVALFLGNIVITAVWKTIADRTGDPRTVAFAQRQARNFATGGPGLEYHWRLSRR